MARRFKLIFGSVAFFVGVLLIVFSLSNFISTLLMLIGVIFNNIHNTDSADDISIY